MVAIKKNGLTHWGLDKRVTIKRNAIVSLRLQQNDEIIFGNSENHFDMFMRVYISDYRSAMVQVMAWCW